LIAALAHNSTLSVRTDIDDCSPFSDCFWGSRHRAFDDLLIRHLSGRHIVLLGKCQPRNEDDRTPQCQRNVPHETISSSFVSGTIALPRPSANNLIQALVEEERQRFRDWLLQLST
jgi:hypothetical protein